MRLRPLLLAIAGLSVVNPALANAEKPGQSDQPALDTNTDPRVSQKPVDLSTLPTDMDVLFPLTPEERVRIRERQLRDQNATYKPLRDVKPVRELVSISGNADTIPEIFVTPDYPSAIVFTDITGAPWPIQYIGQTSSLANVHRPEGSENSLVLLANNGAGRKSVTVFLEGLTLPVTITVTGKNNEYHALKHIRITERGPNSSIEKSVASGASAAAVSLDPTGDEGTNLDVVLNKLAYKVTPDDFKKLKASDSRVDAWINEKDNKYLYLRTDYTVVSPGPRAGNRGVTPVQDDVRIYILPRVNPVMVLDETGQRRYLSFKE